MKNTELKALIREEVRKALNEDAESFASYYSAYDRDVKNAAKAIDAITIKLNIDSEELFDAIVELVDAVRADRDNEE
jgi:hypothetical protein